MKSRGCILIAAVLCLAAGFPQTRVSAGEESAQEAEAKQFEAEEKAALDQAGKDFLLYTDFTGKLVLYTKEQIEARGGGGVIGSFQVDDKHIYDVKPMNDAVTKALKELDGKTCTLHGKVRNNERYLYVKQITLAGPANTFTK